MKKTRVNLRFTKVSGKKGEELTKVESNPRPTYKAPLAETSSGRSDYVTFQLAIEGLPPLYEQG